MDSSQNSGNINNFYNSSDEYLEDSETDSDTSEQHLDRESRDTFMSIHNGEEYRRFLNHAIENKRGIPGYSFFTNVEDEHAWVTNTVAGTLLQEIINSGLITWNAQDCSYPDKLFPKRSASEINKGLLGSNCRASLIFSARKTIALKLLEKLHQRGFRSIICNQHIYNEKKFEMLKEINNEFDNQIPRLQPKISVLKKKYDSITEIDTNFIGARIPHHYYVITDYDPTNEKEFRQNYLLRENINQNWMHLMVIDPLFNRPMSYKSGLLTQLYDIMSEINA